MAPRTADPLDKAAAAARKAAPGFSGCDQISGGGLPRRRTTLWMGGTGPGKTIFAMPWLMHGARLCDEPGIFVALEESPVRIAMASS